MTLSMSFVTRSALLEMMSKRDRVKQFAVGVACAFVPALLTAHFVARRFSKPTAWFVSFLPWLLLAFWIPPRPRIRFAAWFGLAALFSVFVWFVVRLQPNWY